MSVIAFLSDFGLKDQYIAQVKSVIYSICPSAYIIDLTHMVDSFCIECASYIIDTSIEWFPEDTVFLAVVDPGVGGERKPIILRGFSRWFIGPDNGVFSTIIREESTRAWVIKPNLLPVKKISYTFHGRDVFGPAAALLSCGKPPEEIGEEIDRRNLVTFDLIWEKSRDSEICLKVIYIDKYGNIALSKKGGLDIPIGSRLKVRSRGLEYEAYYTRSFSLVKEGELSIYINSFGYLELAVNRGDASSLLKSKIGDEICLIPV